eukprot:TRINITY_DN5771_c0_g1_i1.p1 TRINITY_DN5771_c0_g1~~TRINITY_DN5771_c0_g1_i1.p1  ORF type:complete len:1404 (-),score=573.46 TRINITY_DN5771_c0_g1_i1:30-4241(-)
MEVEVYQFEGHARTKLETQLDEAEEGWIDERWQRLQLQKDLAREKKAANDLHWELQETKNALAKELKASQEVRRDWEASKQHYEAALQAEKQLKREKKEMKERMSGLVQQMEGLEKEIKKMKEEEKRLLGVIQELQLESAREEERDGYEKEREMNREREKVRDLEKRMEEMKRGFEIERGRYQNRSLEFSNDLKRMQIERDKAFSDLQLKEKAMGEKNKLLLQALEEVDKLEEEAKSLDEEIEKLHGKVLELEQEKRKLRRDIEETKREASEKLTKETADYVEKLNDLRIKNQKLTLKLDESQLEKEQQFQNEKNALLGVLEDLKIDMQVLVDENKRLNMQLKEIRKEEMKSNPRGESESLKLRQEIDALRSLTDKIKFQKDEEHKQFTLELEEEQKRSAKLHREIDTLKKEIQFVKSESKELMNELERKISKLEEKNKRLLNDVSVYKKENERLIVDQQQLKNISESELRRKIENVAALETEIAELEKKYEKTEEKLKNANFDLKQSSAEIERLNEALHTLKKDKTKQDEKEKNETQILNETKQKENELNAQIQALSKTIESYKERSKLSEQKVQILTAQLSSASDQLKASSLAEEKLKLELSSSLARLKEVEIKLSERDKIIVELQEKAILDSKLVNQQILELQNQISRLKGQRDKSHKEEMDRLTANFESEQKQREIEHNHAVQAFKTQLDDTNILVASLRRQISDNEQNFKRREEELLVLRKQVADYSSTEVILSDTKKLYENCRADLKNAKQEILKLSSEKDSSVIQNTKLQKQIENLEGSLKALSSLRNDLENYEIKWKEEERKFHGEIASRDTKIAGLVKSSEALKAELKRLNEENLLVEAEMSKLVKALEEAKADQEKLNLTVTLTRLREELKEKEENNQKLLADYSQSKRSLEGRIATLEEQLKLKNVENQELIKTKETLQIDLKQLQQILEKNISKNTASGGSNTEASQLQLQVIKLNEQLTQMSLENSDLQDQLDKTEKDKSDLEKELIGLKAKREHANKQKEKKKREKENTNIRRDLQRLKPTSNTSVAVAQPKEDDDTIRAAIFLQSRLRGLRARRQYNEHKLRFSITKEILSTEQSYSASMRTVVDTYIQPLRKLAYLTEEEISIIFGNIEQISSHTQIVTELLEEKVESWNVHQCIGDVFVQNLEALKPHVQYIQHFSTTQEAKEKVLSGNNTNIEMFFRIVQMMPQVESKKLNDFLIMPVQRIPRYKLLLEDLLKHTPKHHPDYTHLNNASLQIGKLAQHINDNNRKVETLMAMANCSISGLEKLPPNKDRGLLLTGHLAVIIGTAKVTNCNVHIFTDAIVFTKESRKSRLSIKLSEKILGTATEKLHHFIPITPSLDVVLHEKFTIYGNDHENVIQIADLFLLFASATAKMHDFFNHIVNAKNRLT